MADGVLWELHGSRGEVEADLAEQGEGEELALMLYTDGPPGWDDEVALAVSVRLSPEQAAELEAALRRWREAR